jgi:sodium/hydrogen exchanger-like protein 6/7
LESCIISLLAYSSYLLSNSIQLSGIVSLLFCGITMKHYAYDNMSIRSRRTTKYMWRVLSQLSENFIFIYLGVTLFTKEEELYLPGFIFFTLVRPCYCFLDLPLTSCQHHFLTYFWRRLLF